MGAINLFNLAGRAVDRTVEVFNPGEGAKRRILRTRLNAIDQAERRNTAHRYAAGSTSTLDSWSCRYPADPNALIAQHLNTVTARTQQLVRDFPYFRRAVNSLVNVTVGTGIKFESRVTDPAGQLDKKTCRKIEDALSFWYECADASGKLEFWEMQRLAKRQELETGEFIAIKRNKPRPGKYSRFALQFHEGSRLSDTSSQSSPTTDIFKGVEFDRETGEAMAYHFTSGTSPYTATAAVTMRAADVMHGFEVRRPGQLRGITMFTPAILLANSLQEYLGAEVDGAKMAAKYLALIETPDPIGSQDSRGGYDSETRKRIEELGNAFIEYLSPGEKVQFPQHNRPGSNFDPFVRLILRMIAVSTDVPYELLSGDYSGLDFSNLRGSRLDLKRDIAPHQQMLVRWFVRPAIRSAISSLVLEGKLDLPGYWNAPEQYWRGEFIPCPLEAIDKWKEAEGDLAMVKMGADNLQRLAAENGQNFVENMMLLKQASDAAGAAGVNLVDALFQSTVPGGAQQLLDGTNNAAKSKKS